jgi:hypothetical protein
MLDNIVSLTGCTPNTAGDCAAWESIVENGKLERLNLCKVLKGKRLLMPLRYIHVEA